MGDRIFMVVEYQWLTLVLALEFQLKTTLYYVLLEV